MVNCVGVAWFVGKVGNEWSSFFMCGGLGHVVHNLGLEHGLHGNKIGSR